MDLGLAKQLANLLEELWYYRDYPLQTEPDILKLAQEMGYVERAADGICHVTAAGANFLEEMSNIKMATRLREHYGYTKPEPVRHATWGTW